MTDALECNEEPFNVILAALNWIGDYGEILLPEYPTVGDLISSKFVKDAQMYLLGVKTEVAPEPFKGLFEYYREEFTDIPMVMTWLETVGVDTEVLDSLVKRFEGSCEVQDIKNYSITKLVALLNQIYRMLSILVVTSVRGRNMGWATTNINYMPAKDKVVLRKLTPYHGMDSAKQEPGSEADESLEVKRLQEQLEDARLFEDSEHPGEKYFDLLQKNEELRERLLEQEWIVEQLRQRLEKKDDRIREWKDEAERLRGVTFQNQKGVEYRRGIFEVRILESILRNSTLKR